MTRQLLNFEEKMFVFILPGIVFDWASFNTRSHFRYFFKMNLILS